MESPDRDFVILIDYDGAAGMSLIHLSQVRMVTEMSPGHCRIWFSEHHSIAVKGSGASELALQLLDRSRLPNGDAFDTSKIRATYEESLLAQKTGPLQE
ncbi:MAG: hypothetical protein ABSG26_14150 [Bryobacteraceae bacterium]|jgi:hypothetical protein